MLTIGFEEMAGGGEAGEMFEEKAAFAASAEREFADELLVSSTLVRGSLDVAEQFAVGHSDYGSGWRERQVSKSASRQIRSQRTAVVWTGFSTLALFADNRYRTRSIPFR